MRAAQGLGPFLVWPAPGLVGHVISFSSEAVGTWPWKDGDGGGRARCCSASVCHPVTSIQLFGFPLAQGGWKLALLAALWLDFDLSSVGVSGFGPDAPPPETFAVGQTKATS